MEIYILFKNFILFSFISNNLEVIKLSIDSIPVNFKVYADKDFNHVKDDNKQIEVIHVKFNVALTDEEKFEKNKENLPGLPEKEPETGDASLFVYGAVALASAAGLYVINNKKDKKDDEE